METWPVIGGGVTFMALISVAVLLVYRQVWGLIRENNICNRRLGILFRLAVKNKLDIPPEYFDEVEEVVHEELPPRK